MSGSSVKDILGKEYVEEALKAGIPYNYLLGEALDKSKMPSDMMDKDQAFALKKYLQYKNDPTLGTSIKQEEKKESDFLQDNSFGRGLGSLATRYTNTLNAISAGRLYKGLSALSGKDIQKKFNEYRDFIEHKKDEKNAYNPQRKKQIDALRKRSAEAKGLWNNLKAGGVSMLDTIKHPEEWTIEGAVDNVLDPINLVSFGVGGLAAKVLSRFAPKVAESMAAKIGIGSLAGSIEGGGVSGIQNFTEQIGAGKTLDEAIKSGIQATSGGALAGIGLGGIGGAMGGIKSNKEPSNTNKDYVNIQNEILNNALLQTDDVFEQTKIKDNQSKLQEEMQENLKNSLEDLSKSEEEADFISQKAKELAKMGQEDLSSIPVSDNLKTQSYILNDGNNIIDPRLEGVGIINVVRDNINHSTQSPQEFYTKLIYKGVGDELAKISTQSYATKNPIILENHILEKLQNHIDEKMHSGLRESINNIPDRDMGLVIKKGMLVDDIAGVKEPIVYKVIPASELKPNFKSGEGTQFRFADNRVMISKITNNFDADLHFGREGGFDGPPLIDFEGNIITGNHRASSIRNLYTEGKAQAYKEGLAKYYPEVLESNILDPVLVRELVSTDKTNIQRIAKVSNENRSNSLADALISNAAKIEPNINRLPPIIKNNHELSNYLMIQGLNARGAAEGLLGYLNPKIAKQVDLYIRNKKNEDVFDLLVDNAYLFWNAKTEAKEHYMEGVDISNLLDIAIEQMAMSVETPKEQMKKLIDYYEDIFTDNPGDKRFEQVANISELKGGLLGVWLNSLLGRLDGGSTEFRKRFIKAINDAKENTRDTLFEEKGNVQTQWQMIFYLLNREKSMKELQVEGKDIGELNENDKFELDSTLLPYPYNVKLKQLISEESKNDTTIHMERDISHTEGIPESDREPKTMGDTSLGTGSRDLQPSDRRALSDDKEPTGKNNLSKTTSVEHILGNATLFEQPRSDQEIPRSNSRYGADATNGTTTDSFSSNIANNGTGLQRVSDTTEISRTARGYEESGQVESGLHISEIKGDITKSKPLKDFGTNYPQFYHKGKEAIEHLLNTKEGQVQGAFYKDGLGDIDLVWGDDKMGLKHILNKHPEVIDKIPDIVENGKVESNAGVHTIIANIDSKRYHIGLSKGWFGKGNNNWIITAYENTRLPHSEFRPSNDLMARDGYNLPLNNLHSNPTTQSFKNQDFGTNYPQFYHKGKEAIEHLLNTKEGQVQGAFYKDGLGDIDLVWGEVTNATKHTGYGLAHIIDKHPDIVNKIPEIIEKGKIESDAGVHTIIANIDSKRYHIGLSKGWNKEGNNNWIITAYENTRLPHSDVRPSNELTKRDGNNLPLNNLDSNPTTQSFKNQELTPIESHFAQMDEKINPKEDIKPYLSETVEAHKKALQDKSELKRSIKFNDLEDIAKDLPYLLEEQIADVKFAEERFQKGGRGVLFTNGTGTGKTFTGLGIIKRKLKAGAKNILVITPSSQKNADWIKEGKKLNINLKEVASTKDNPSALAVVTYSNFRENESLLSETYDLIVYDESHNIMGSKDGKITNSYQAHKRITLENYIDKIEPKDSKYRNTEQTIKQALQLAKNDQVVFLSATPFASHKSLFYGEGLLFDRVDDDFFKHNFAYTIRYNKLTRPDIKVDVGLLERRFADNLKKQGVMRGRTLQSNYDYSRQFMITDGTKARFIDRALEILNANYKDYKLLLPYYRDKLNYHYVNKLMESLKASSTLDFVKDNIAKGRKVVIFHSYNEGGVSHPFIETFSDYGRDKEKIIEEYQHFKKQYPDFFEPLNLENPLDLYASELKGKVGFYNGKISAKERSKNLKDFNDDDSGIDVLVVQIDAGGTGLSMHDTTGLHPRVMLKLNLPVKPVIEIQSEGRIFRVGQKSNAAYVYPVTHLGIEQRVFGTSINGRIGTVENLALGSEARNLKESFKQSYLNAKAINADNLKFEGGKEKDRSHSEMDEFQVALNDYYTYRPDKYEGTDYFPTPEPIGLMMSKWADIEPTESVLEPSAGNGAIARYFPENARATLIEPSAGLFSKLIVNVNSQKPRLIQGIFEDLSKNNKFDTIVMNPPFGKNSKMAYAHLIKATEHLYEGGRIVAIVPSGESMKTVIPSGFHKILEISLPSVTFERANTKQKTKILIIDKTKHPVFGDDIDLSHIKNINDLFEAIKDIQVPIRNRAIREEFNESPNSLVNNGVLSVDEKKLSLSYPKGIYLLNRWELSKIAQSLGGELKNNKFIFKDETGFRRFIDMEDC